MPKAAAIQGPLGLDERLWFPRYADIVVPLIQTNEGRDLLGLPSWTNEPWPIISLARSSYATHKGWSARGEHRGGHFSPGAVYGDIMRDRWKDIEPALTRMAFDQIQRWPSLNTRARFHATRFAHLVVSPDAHVESKTVDGAVSTDEGDAAWRTVLDAAGDGHQDSASGDGLDCAGVRTSGTTDQWRICSRGIFLYLTGNDIGASDTVDDGEASLYITGVVNAFGGAVNFVGVTPASDTDLVNTDYGQFDTTTYATAINISAITTGQFTDWTLNSTGLSNITKGANGVTKHGCRIVDDINYIANPGSTPWSSATWDLIQIRFVDYTPTGSEPHLDLNYTVDSPSFVPRTIMI